MPARGRVWQEIPGAGRRGTGAAAGGLDLCGNVERLRSDERAGSGLLS